MHNELIPEIKNYLIYFFNRYFPRVPPFIFKERISSLAIKEFIALRWEGSLATKDSFLSDLTSEKRKKSGTGNKN